MKLTNQVLLALGFDRIPVSAEESGDTAYEYYTLTLNEYECLISNSDPQNEEYTVDLFNTELGKCYTDEDVKNLYLALMRKPLKTGKKYDELVKFHKHVSLAKELNIKNR